MTDGIPQAGECDLQSAHKRARIPRPAFGILQDCMPLSVKGRKVRP